MSATALKTHMLGHSGERPFICTLCEYSSKQVGDLKKHMLIHLGERPFNCTQCNQAFKTSLELKQHILNHKERSLMCVTFATILLQMPRTSKHIS